MCGAGALARVLSIPCSLENPGKGKRHHSQLSITSHEFLPRHHKLSPTVSQCKNTIAARHRCNASKFSDILSFFLNPESCRGNRPLNFEPGEHAMHCSARPDSLHNLLPDVTTLAEVQRPLLSCFLRQISRPDIDA